MWMIVGLGNPGSKYAFNRHNIGFMLIDALAQALNHSVWKTQEKALVTKVEWNQNSTYLIKPQTFMNRSGESVIPLLNYYKVDTNKLCVIQDDIDQPFGQIKLQHNRGHGGHNGVRHISEQLGHSNYTRLKLGVGRPHHPEMNVADWVLQNFSKEEMDQIPLLLQSGADAISSLMTKGYQRASTEFNGTNTSKKL